MLDSYSVREPILPTELAEKAIDGIKNGNALEAVRVAGVSITGAEARAITVESSEFEGVELSSCLFKKATMTDVVLQDCLFFGSNFDGSGWLRVEFRKGMHFGYGPERLLVAGRELY